MSGDLTIKLLRESVDKPVIVKLKGGKTIRGILIGFDEHLNLVLKNSEFLLRDEVEQVGNVVLRGDNVVFISPPQE